MYSRAIITTECYLAGNLFWNLGSTYIYALFFLFTILFTIFRCWLLWDNILGANFNRNRMRFKVESMQVLDVNITTTLLELYQMVKNNWMNDFYSNHSKQALNPPVYRRRSPFVAFALKNDTGSPLHFTTFISEVEKSASKHKSYELNEKWVKVMPGEVVPFTFKGRGTIFVRTVHVQIKFQKTLQISCDTETHTKQNCTN